MNGATQAVGPWYSLPPHWLQCATDPPAPEPGVADGLTAVENVVGDPAGGFDDAVGFGVPLPPVGVGGLEGGLGVPAPPPAALQSCGPGI